MAAMNNIAKARDEFFEANPDLANDRTVTHEYYLRNRLEISFIAGWNACVRQYGIKEPDHITEPIGA